MRLKLLEPQASSHLAVHHKSQKKPRYLPLTLFLWRYDFLWSKPPLSWCAPLRVFKKSAKPWVLGVWALSFSRGIFYLLLTILRRDGVAWLPLFPVWPGLSSHPSILWCWEVWVKACFHARIVYCWDPFRIPCCPCIQWTENAFLPPQHQIPTLWSHFIFQQVGDLQELPYPWFPSCQAPPLPGLL